METHKQGMLTNEESKCGNAQANTQCGHDIATNPADKDQVNDLNVNMYKRISFPTEYHIGGSTCGGGA